MFPNCLDQFVLNRVNELIGSIQVLQIKLQNGEACRSVMWKKDTRDCILSRHSRVDRIRHFLVAPNLEIDFYENICTQTQVSGEF